MEKLKAFVSAAWDYAKASFNAAKSVVDTAASWIAAYPRLALLMFVASLYASIKWL